MIVPVHVHHRDLEEDLCYFDNWEKSVICDDYYAEHEYTVDDVEFEYADLEDIVREYTDDIIDILLSDKRLTNALFKKMRSRKIDVSSIISADGEKNAKR
ncbi:MAG: cysteinyl-tRNA synthetase [Sulfolobus sp.]